MELNDEIRKLIMRGDDAVAITNAARRNGMRNLREDGWLKVAERRNHADEVMRVTQEFLGRWSWRTHSCVPRSHSCERAGAQLRSVALDHG